MPCCLEGCYLLADGPGRSPTKVLETHLPGECPRDSSIPVSLYVFSPKAGGLTTPVHEMFCENSVYWSLPKGEEDPTLQKPMSRDFDKNTPIG
jgi:hypothetical protein